MLRQPRPWRFWSDRFWNSASAFRYPVVCPQMSTCKWSHFYIRRWSSHDFFFDFPFPGSIVGGYWIIACFSFNRQVVSSLLEHLGLISWILPAANCHPSCKHHLKHGNPTWQWEVLIYGWPLPNGEEYRWILPGFCCQELIGRCCAWQTRGVWYAGAVKCRPWSAGPAGPSGKMGDMVPPR